jgi:uncharacterized glyoxalase superfamily protein PhnB
MPSIAPWLSVKNATEALAYYRAAFGATELERGGRGANGLGVCDRCHDDTYKRTLPSSHRYAHAY